MWSKQILRPWNGIGTSMSMKTTRLHSTNIQLMISTAPIQLSDQYLMMMADYWLTETICCSSQLLLLIMFRVSQSRLSLALTWHGYEIKPHTTPSSHSPMHQQEFRHFLHQQQLWYNNRCVRRNGMLISKSTVTLIWTICVSGWVRQLHVLLIWTSILMLVSRIIGKRRLMKCEACIELEAGSTCPCRTWACSHDVVALLSRQTQLLTHGWPPHASNGNTMQTMFSNFYYQCSQVCRIQIILVVSIAGSCFTLLTRSQNDFFIPDLSNISFCQGLRYFCMII